MDVPNIVGLGATVIGAVTLVLTVVSDFGSIVEDWRNLVTKKKELRDLEEGEGVKLQELAARKQRAEGKETLIDMGEQTERNRGSALESKIEANRLKWDEEVGLLADLVKELGSLGILNEGRVELVSGMSPRSTEDIAQILSVVAGLLERSDRSGLANIKIRDDFSGLGDILNSEYPGKGQERKRVDGPVNPSGREVGSGLEPGGKRRLLKAVERNRKTGGSGTGRGWKRDDGGQRNAL
ncbi:hypothetical protein GCM10027294_21350 [Marinactinospora endophytica]